MSDSFTDRDRVLIALENGAATLNEVAEELCERPRIPPDELTAARKIARRELIELIKEGTVTRYKRKPSGVILILSRPSKK